MTRVVRAIRRSFSGALMDVAACAAFLGCSEKTVRARLHDPLHPLPARRLGARIVFRRTELERWLDELPSVTEAHQRDGDAMSLPYFRYFLGDHLKAKIGMNHEQKGIYGDLLEISWEQTPPGTLPNDPAEIARLVGVPLKRFTPHVPIVLRAWKRQGKRLVHDWLQQEYVEKVAKHTERSDAGKKGNEKRWHGSLSDRSAITKGSQSESESNSKKREKYAAAARPDSLSSSDESGNKTVSLKSTELQAVWDAYAPHRRGSKADVIKAWTQAHDRPALDVLLKAIERQRQSKDWVDGVILKLPNWLNQEGWKHEPPPVDPTKYCQNLIDGHRCLQKAHTIDLHNWHTNTALASMCKSCWEDWRKTAPNRGRALHL